MTFIHSGKRNRTLLTLSDVTCLVDVLAPSSRLSTLSITSTKDLFIKDVRISLSIGSVFPSQSVHSHENETKSSYEHHLFYVKNKHALQ